MTTITHPYSFGLHFSRVQKKHCTSVLGGFNKTKIWNLNLLTLFSHSITMWVISKKFETSWTSGMPPIGIPQNGSDPFISKKNHSHFRIQINRLGLTNSTQKAVLRNMNQVPRYRPKCVKFCWFGLEGRFSTLFW